MSSIKHQGNVHRSTYVRMYNWIENKNSHTLSSTFSWTIFSHLGLHHLLFSNNLVKFGI